MAKNSKKSKPTVSKSSLSAKPKISSGKSKVSRNIKVDKQNAAINAEKLDIKFQSYNFFSFPSNFLFILVLMYLIRLFWPV